MLMSVKVVLNFTKRSSKKRNSLKYEKIKKKK